MFCQGDGTYAAQMNNKQSKNFSKRPHRRGIFMGETLAQHLSADKGICAVAYVCAVRQLRAANVAF